MNTRVCDCTYQPNEVHVQSNLAITPSQMLEMANDGTPISAQNLGILYDEGFAELDFTPDLEHQRGVDINDMWNARQSTKKKIRDAKAAGKMQPVVEDAN